MKRAAWFVAFIAIVAAVVAVNVAVDDDEAEASALRTFDDCAALDAYVDQARATGPKYLGRDIVVEDRATATAAAPASTEHSTTNVQEESVDEPDIVKTDGSLVVAAVNGHIQIVDAASRRVRSTLDLTGELLLHDDRLLVFGRMVGAARIRGPVDETTTITAVDLADPDTPEVVGTTNLDGGYVSARMVGDVVRVVVRQYTFTGGVPCERVYAPPVPSGPGTTTVATFDATGDLDPIDTETVIADAQTIYASEDRLYVVTQTPNAMTQLHAFATDEDGGIDYLGSGEAPGFLLNQFSLSEDGGVLRVATTTQTDSMITTFDEDGTGLRPLGDVRGLGPGERIYAVRYLGDTAYVVTFRETDPLYAVDLSDPRSPRVLGELKIPGFSNYLHPIGDGGLLGVGRIDSGAKVSLFDVSNPVAPTELDVVVAPGTWTPVESDHHAFLWWARTYTAVVPLETSALVLTVDGDDLRERGRVSDRFIVRSLVIGDELWTLSDTGLLASDLDTLAERGRVAF